MSLLDRFKKKPKAEQAVIVALVGSGIEQSFYQHDLSTLEDQIIESLHGTGLGALDGNEIGPSGCALYLYGPDAEMLYARIEPILRPHPLCQSCRVTIRRGGPGAPQREVRI
jgi:hypothetical protein